MLPKITTPLIEKALNDIAMLVSDIEQVRNKSAISFQGPELDVVPYCRLLVKAIELGNDKMDADRAMFARGEIPPDHDPGRKF